MVDDTPASIQPIAPHYMKVGKPSWVQLYKQVWVSRQKQRMAWGTMMSTGWGGGSVDLKQRAWRGNCGGALVGVWRRRKPCYHHDVVMEDLENLVAQITHL
jgi:hypothetical protein